SDAVDQVSIPIYAGTSAEGTPVQTPTASPSEGGGFSANASKLADGTYTAVAEQSELGETGTSLPVTFTVDTAPPEVTMEPVGSPTSEPSPRLEGHLGSAEGDDHAVTVTI